MAADPKPNPVESKQVMFHRLYPHHYAEMRSKVMIGNQWGGEGVRQRVRGLARQETRLHVKALRRAKEAKP